MPLITYNNISMNYDLIAQVGPLPTNWNQARVVWANIQFRSIGLTTEIAKDCLNKQSTEARYPEY
jgi:hypothetical protein